MVLQRGLFCRALAAAPPCARKVCLACILSDHIQSLQIILAVDQSVAEKSKCRKGKISECASLRLQVSSSPVREQQV